MEQEQKIPVNIEDEMKRSYLDYAMSVIIGRALPDVRDGLKPVHRRVLWTMNELSNHYNKPYKKSARVVGDCIGKYHPHGDVAVYDTIVRLVQEFSMRVPLIDGQGNFGCFTGDTKIKLLDGTEKSFEELAQLNPNEIFYVYSVDQTGRVVVGEGRNSRITRKQASLIELTLDSGAKIRCTPDHLFMLRDGTYKQASALTSEDSLMPGYFKLTPIKEGLNPYLQIMQPKTGSYEFVHHLADEFNHKKGATKYVSGPFVRHHKNFNRLDNNPTNIERLGFLEHLHLHAEQIGMLWQDEDFRKKQKQGVQNYYLEHPEVLLERKNRFITQNKDANFRAQNGERISSRLKKFFQENPEAKNQISIQMKALWKDPDYRKKMSKALVGIEKRPLTSEQKQQVAKIISEKSKLMWADQSKKAEIIATICHALSSQEVRAKISSNSKANWQNPVYRSKYPSNHFSQMAKSLWQDPQTRITQQKKIAQQRQDPDFLESQRLAVQRTNASRLQNNPNMMFEMAQLAANELTQKWRDPSYKQKIMQQKVAKYVSNLIAQFGLEKVTPNLYENCRNANWIPNLQKALNYFHDFEAIIDTAKTYNHRIIDKKFLDQCLDVYDITVDTHHNFLLADGVFVHNSVDGDAPAAMRYTEVRMAKIAEMMLADIEKETVDFHPNYDETLEEPVVLPARFPNLLVNGASGIAVGMATNIPPHNLTEIIEATVYLIQNPNAVLADIIKIVQGPDFPTAGFILGREGIRQAYETGRGSIIMRARAAIDRSVRNEAREAIVVTQIPYQVNKAKLIERIAELINEKKIEDISDLRDESDREGMRIVIELKRGAVAQVVLNNLYKLTPMQTSFGIINLAIVAGQPRVLSLVETLRLFINFRKEIVRRRTEFELRKAKARQHILQGLMRALDHLDAIIKLIRAARSVVEAREGLVSQFAFSLLQAQAILDLQLQKLTGLEREKIANELKELERRIAELEEILSNEITLKNLIIKELREVQKDFSTERRTQIIDAEADLKLEDLIPDEDMVITVTHGGYIKRTPLTNYRNQRRGGTGKKGMTTRTEDIVSHIFIASSHSYILIFSDRGQAYTLKVHEIPDVSAAGKGKAIVNLINLPGTEKVAGVLAIKEFSEDRYVVMVTRKGTIKKTQLSDFAYSRSRGILAINVDDDDELIATEISDGKKKVFIATHDGMAIYFKESDVRSMGRQAHGVRGIDLRESDYVVGVAVVTGEEKMLTIAEYGLGKRTELSEYRFQSRGGVGVINMKLTDRTGAVVAVMPVSDEDEIMIISVHGKVIRLNVGSIRETGRSAQGVKLIDTADGDYVASASLIERQVDPIPENTESK